MYKILIPDYDMDYHYPQDDFTLDLVRRALMSLRFYSKKDSLSFIMPNGKVVMATTFNTENHVSNGVVNSLGFTIGRLEDIVSIGELLSLFIVAKLYHDEGYALLDEC